LLLTQTKSGGETVTQKDDPRDRRHALWGVPSARGLRGGTLIGPGHGLRPGPGTRLGGWTAAGEDHRKYRHHHKAEGGSE
jgi:hypothetical protein